MFRTTAIRAIPRSSSLRSPATLKNSAVSNVLKANLRTSSKPNTTSNVLSVALRQPLQKSLVRYQSGTAYQAASFVKGLSKEAEAGYGQEKLAAPPQEQVTVDSSVHPVTGEVGQDAAEQDVDMGAGIRNDFVRCTMIYSADSD